MLTANDFFALPPDRISAEVETRFFGALKTGNATFKQTGAGRLAAVDAALVAALARSGARVDTVLDLGISSGVTTLEMIDALRLAGHAARTTGTDRLVGAALVDLPMQCRALVEPGGHVLQYEVLGRGLRPWRRRLDYVTGMAAVRGLVGLMLGRQAAARLRSGDGARQVALVSPRLARATGVTLVEDDVTTANPAFANGFDLIRAANILNRHYFAPDALARAIANVRSYLKGPGSWWLVVRTHGASDHRGTLFRLDDAGQLAVVERIGSGSEVEDLILATNRGS